MAYKPFPFTEFGGLDLRSAPDGSACINCLDVEFDRPGQVRQRDYFGEWIANTGQTSPTLLRWPGREYLVTSIATELDLYDGAGGVIASGVAATARFKYAQAIGTTSTNYLYLSDGVGSAGGGVTIRRLATDGTLTAPAGMPNARFVALQPAANRLVAANLSGNAHRVQFSDALAAETWTAANVVDLDAGDGEEITALVSWRDLLFAFKESKFFVFYGNSVQADGDVEFNYRSFRGGLGASAIGSGSASDPSAVAGPDGVYFLVVGKGVYRTTGGEPVEVSAPIRPAFTDHQLPFFTSGSIGQYIGLYSVGDNIYLQTINGTGSDNVLFKYSPQDDYWTVIDLAGQVSVAGQVADIHNFSSAVEKEQLVIAPTGANAPVHRMRGPTDFTAPFTDSYRVPTGLYRSGFADMGVHDEKRIVQWDLWGTGTVGLKTSRDFGSLGSATNLTLGTSPAIDYAVARKAVDGTLVSFELSSVSGGSWSVQRVVPRLDAARTPTTKTP